MFWSSPRWEDIPFWALDLETGGLDPKRDPILSVGMVPVRSGVIRLAEAFESLVRPEGATISPASIEVHQLMPTEVREAPFLSEVLVEIEERVGDGVLLVHHAPIDVAFLKRAYAERSRRWPGFPVVDTVRLLWKLDKRRRFTRPGGVVDPQLNLADARRARGLPEYPGHQALSDALATAELFLVLRHELDAHTLRDLR